MNRPRIFLSAVSEELRTARQAVAATVRTLGYDPVSQDDFPTGYGELRQWLREQIDSCEGLIQLVGHAYGVEPPEVDPDYGRVSYTQLEFFYARHQDKKTWVIMVGEGCHRDKLRDRLDLPREAAHPDPGGYQAERRKLQEDYIARLTRENHLRHTANNDTELQNIVLRLRDELGELRQLEDRKQRRLTVAIIAILLVLMILSGGIWWVYHRLHTDVQQAGVVNTEKIRAHLLQTSEETHRRELAEADAATDWKKRQRLLEAAQIAHAARLSRIEELAASFAEIEGRGTGTSVFQEMTRILTEQGVDAAIAYVGTQRSSILQTVRARVASARERNRADLQPLLRTAALHEAKGQPAEARALYIDILAAEPDWPDALHAAFWFLVGQGDLARVRTTLADVRRDYEEAHRLAQRITTYDPRNTQGQRDLAVSYGNLGDVAVAQGKLEEAALAYGEGLAIAKKLAEGDPSNTEWQRDLALFSERHGNVAVAQGKLEEAARAYGEGLAIRQKLAEGDPSNTEWQRDLSVSYIKLGDVAVAQGKMADAARAYGEGLAIAKKLAAGDPSNTEWQQDLAASSERVGNVAVAQGKLEEAARAYGEGLAIAKKLAAGDPSNTELQRNLSVSSLRLGEVAVAQGQLADAAQAYGDGLAIRQKLAAGDPSNTQWQRDLSISYHKLGDVARAQGKLADAARAYGDGLAIRQKLAAGDPSNTQWQRDLSVFSERLGNVAMAQGKLEEAARAYGEGLAIVKKLAGSDPSNTQWLRDLWVSYWKLADLAERRNKASEAQVYWKQALDVLSGIEKRGLHLTPEDRQWLEILRRKACAAAR